MASAWLFVLYCWNRLLNPALWYDLIRASPHFTLCSQANGLHGGASCCSALRERGSRIWPRLWPLRPTTPPSSPSPPQTSCPNGWERVRSMSPIFNIPLGNKDSLQCALDLLPLLESCKKNKTRQLSFSAFPQFPQFPTIICHFIQRTLVCLTVSRVLWPTEPHLYCQH